MGQEVRRAMLITMHTPSGHVLLTYMELKSLYALPDSRIHHSLGEVNDR